LSRSGKDREIAACELDHDGLRRQRDRYRRLGREVEGIERDLDSLTVRFRPTVDEALLAEAIEVERACCPFFGLDYWAFARRLRVTVASRGQVVALDAIAAALGDCGSGPRHAG
jgi:hypothetical protein